MAAMTSASSVVARRMLICIDTLLWNSPPRMGSPHLRDDTVYYTTRGGIVQT